MVKIQHTRMAQRTGPARALDCASLAVVLAIGIPLAFDRMRRNGKHKKPGTGRAFEFVVAEARLSNYMRIEIEPFPASRLISASTECGRSKAPKFANLTGETDTLYPARSVKKCGSTPLFQVLH